VNVKLCYAIFDQSVRAFEVSVATVLVKIVVVVVTADQFSTRVTIVLTHDDCPKSLFVDKWNVGVCSQSLKRLKVIRGINETKALPFLVTKTLLCPIGRQTFPLVTASTTLKHRGPHRNNRPSGGLPGSRRDSWAFFFVNVKPSTVFGRKGVQYFRRRHRWKGVPVSDGVVLIICLLMFLDNRVIYFFIILFQSSYPY